MSSGSVASAGGPRGCTSAAMRWPARRWAHSGLSCPCPGGSAPSPVESHVVELERDHLHVPHAGRVQHLDHRPVAQPDGIVDVAAPVEAFPRLRGAENTALGNRCRPAAAVPAPRPDCAAGGPGASSSGTTSRRATSREYCERRAHRLAVLLAQEQVPLIAFEHRPRHLDRIVDPRAPRTNA